MFSVCGVQKHHRLLWLLLLFYLDYHVAKMPSRKHFKYEQQYNTIEIQKFHNKCDKYRCLSQLLFTGTVGGPAGDLLQPHSSAVDSFFRWEILNSVFSIKSNENFVLHSKAYGKVKWKGGRWKKK